MNFISSLKSQIYVVQNTSFTGMKINNFVVCENTVEVISLPPVHFIAVDTKLAILCALLFYVQTRLTKYSDSFFFFSSVKRKKNTIACLAVFTPLLNLDPMLISQMTTPSYPSPGPMGH